jgi:serine/threonine protein kinase/tetratricopeptide (TPR) repeat protein
MDDAGDDSTKLHDLLGLGLNEPVEAVWKTDRPRIIPSAGSDFAGFHLLEQIGEGGMGVIYRAREHATERIVAVKMIAENLVGVEEVRLRFKQEVRAAVALKHEHILPVYDVNEWEGVPYFSMRLAERGSLMDHLPEYLRQSPREIARLLVKIAQGIQHAHDQNVVHRDLKPGNILLDAQAEPLIADFGLARLVFDNPTPNLTTSLVLLGTPGYIAPELAQGHATGAADIYGLGAILYHLLTGRRPFEGLGGFQSFAQAAKGPPPRARQFKPAIPKALETICDCCLQPDPLARYPSAAAFASELERVMGGRFRRAAPPRNRKRRRKRVLLVLLPCVAVALAATWYFARERPPQSLPPTVKVKSEARYFAERALEILAREHSEPNLRSAEQLMRQALAIDPNAAVVHAELSRILSKIYWHISPEQAVAAEAIAEAEHALRLDPRLTTSHLALADYNFRCRRDYSAALGSLEKAADLDPSDGAAPALAALVLKRLNRWDEALAKSQLACQLDPESAPRHYDLAVTCDFLRRYAEGITAIERARYLAPDNPAHTLLHAWLLFRANGDTSGLERIVATLPFEQQMAPQYFDTVFLWLLWSRRQNEALRLAEALPDDYAVRRYDAYLLKPFFLGLAHRACDNQRASAQAFETTREILESRAVAFPRDARVHAQLGIVYGYLGRPEALREGERAAELLALSQEPVGGSYIATQMAEVYVIIGEIDKALSLIEDLLVRPGHLTVHELKMDPRWNPVRQNARFQRLLGASDAGKFGDN